MEWDLSNFCDTIELLVAFLWLTNLVRRDDPVFDWKFDTLADMADAVEEEAVKGK
jgi:hypothetical protein